MSSPFIPIKTANLEWRENWPYSLDFQDIYFSKDGGLAETHHVFIEGNQLVSRFRSMTSRQRQQFVIGETGFGTGLNFLLTWKLWEQYAPKEATLTYFSCEIHPLALEDLRQCLELWPELNVYANQLLENYPLLTPGHHYITFAQGRVKLIMLLGDASLCYQDLLTTGHCEWEEKARRLTFDAWYLDGFSPAKNESIWSKDLFMTMALLSNHETTLATFTAAGSVKKLLEDSGFIVSKVKGYGNKRHSLTALFHQVPKTEKKSWTTPWSTFSGNRDLPEKKALVIGAGLAGCMLSASLAKRGWKVILVEEGAKQASGASGNPQAVLFPRLSAFKSPFTQFMLDAFVYAMRFYSHFFPISLKGLLLLDSDQGKEFLQLQSWLNAYPELGRLVDAVQASAIAGVPLDLPALFIPHSGWLDSRALCRHFSKESGVTFVSNVLAGDLQYNDGLWSIGQHQAPIAILCNGHRANEFSQTNHLPLKPMRGQMTFIKANEESKKLKVPLCHEGHVLPAYHGLHAIGATYQLNRIESKPVDEDDQMNLEGLKEFAAQVPWSREVQGHWVGVRASTPDYLPLVGQVAIADNFVKDFHGFSTNALRWIPKLPNYYPGLYICAGFGSRGITTIPYTTEWLASVINNEPDFMPRSMIESLSPQRFLFRDICRGKA